MAVTDNVISFSKEKKKRSSGQKNKRGMCQHGFHKWKIWKEKQFDTKEGKLVTVFRCERCGKQKVKVI